jgi:Ni,Fe-hydrogenase I cytochrome b subunit
MIDKYLFKKMIDEFFFIPGTRNIHWVKIISISVLTITLVTLGRYGCKRDRALKKERDQNAEYTIGITKGRHKNIRNASAFVYYYYAYQGEVYKRKQYFPFTRSIKSENGRYYVKFSYKDPTNAELLLDYPVPDSVKKSPYGGWQHLPD